MSIVNGKTEDHLTMLDNMVIERLLNDKWSSFARVSPPSLPFRRTLSCFLQVNFVRQLILLCIHLFFLSTAVFLRNPQDEQISVQRIFCHIAEVCVLIGCIISLFALLAREIYLQGYSSYIQNLVSLSIVLPFTPSFSFFFLEKLSGETGVSMLMPTHTSSCSMPCVVLSDE